MISHQISYLGTSLAHFLRLTEHLIMILIWLFQIMSGLNKNDGFLSGKCLFDIFNLIIRIEYNICNFHIFWNWLHHVHWPDYFIYFRLFFNSTFYDGQTLEEKNNCVLPLITNMDILVLPPWNILSIQLKR